jgi:hypothetical protein
MVIHSPSERAMLRRNGTQENMTSKRNFDAAKRVVWIFGDNREGNMGITNGDVFLEQYPSARPRRRVLQEVATSF